MLKNYFKIACRTILRKRVFSLVNILGLSIGLASVLIISAYLISELSFDAFHKDASRTYRMIEHIEDPGQPDRKVARVGGALGLASSEQIAGVTNHMRMMSLGSGGLNLVYGENEFETPFMVVDSDFFSFFDFPLISGRPEDVFSDPLNVVMSEALVAKFFGSEDPIDRTIKTHLNGEDYLLKVTGVMKKMPDNSHLDVDMLLDFSTINSFFNGFTSYYDGDWVQQSMTTYLKLNDAVDLTSIEAQINEMAKRNKPEELTWERSFSLQPLTDIHFGSAHLEGDMNNRKGDLSYLYIFAFIGVLILAIAFTNYINLSTIKATDRIKEIGLRRVVGADRNQLIMQFMSESVFISLISLILAITMIQFSGPLVILLFESNLLRFIYTTEFLGGLIGTVLVLGMAAGVYPALTVIKGKTVESLRNQTFGGKKQTFFKGVVLFQFITSLVMIVATLVVYNQLSFINDKDLGYDQEALAVIEISSNKARENEALILDGFRKDPDVIGASAVSRVPAEWKSYYQVSLRSNEAFEIEDVPFLGVDENFLDVFDIDLLQGRNFRSGEGDSTKVMINETMARQLGLENAVGQTLELYGVRTGAQIQGIRHTVRFQVIGVINDFHFQSLREEIPPMLFGFKHNILQNIDYYVVKLNANRMGETMERLKGVMKQFDPSPFGFNFLDEKLNRYYVEDEKRSNLFFIAAFIAVFIAFIGLFALVHFALQKRLKEMSIRKVLGANVKSLVILLSKDYAKLLLIALLIAIPISYIGMSNWLEDFVYRTSIEWWVYFLALMVCLGITAITALSQIGKAARKNPSEILRQE